MLGDASVQRIAKIIEGNGLREKAKYLSIVDRSHSKILILTSGQEERVHFRVP